MGGGAPAEVDDEAEVTAEPLLGVGGLHLAPAVGMPHGRGRASGLS